MKHSSIITDITSHLLHEDGSITAIGALAELLVIQIKEHGHIGNVTHHVARGDWAAFLELHQTQVGAQGFKALGILAPRRLI